MKYKRILFFYLIFFTGAALSFGFGYLIREIQGLSETARFPVLEQAYDILSTHAYEDPPEPPALEYGMIRGMLEAYGDPYTRFEEPVQHELTTNSLEGKYGGIGARLSRNPAGQVVLHPFPEGPAAEAGIIDGDILVRVDDLKITPELPLEHVVAAIRGPEGQRVTIEVARPPGESLLAFTIKRKDIPIPSVTWHLAPSNPQVGVFQVNLIAASTPDEIQKAVSDLQQRGATRFIMDLRGNRGGLLEAGVDIARLFLSKGVIFEEQYRGEEVKTYRVRRAGPLADITLAVLINGDTASAAELIAGALQSHNRATLIGTPTFGKDTIQLIFSLQDDSSLHVTAGKWWVPGLEPPIGEGGLQPDIPVTAEGTAGDPYLEAAVNHLLSLP